MPARTCIILISLMGARVAHLKAAGCSNMQKPRSLCRRQAVELDVLRLKNERAAAKQGNGRQQHSWADQEMRFGRVIDVRSLRSSSSTAEVSSDFPCSNTYPDTAVRHIMLAA